MEQYPPPESKEEGPSVSGQAQAPTGSQEHQPEPQVVQYQHQQYAPQNPAEGQVQQGYPIAVPTPGYEQYVAHQAQPGGGGEPAPNPVVGTKQKEQPKVSLSEADGSVVVEMSPDDFENVLSATMHEGGVTLHFRSDGTEGQQTVPIQQVTTVAGSDATTDPRYFIQDIVNAVNNEHQQHQAAQAQATQVQMNGVENETPTPTVPPEPLPPPELPECFRYMDMNNTTGRCMGVLTLNDHEEGERLGPFTGDFVSEAIGCNDAGTWEICVKGKTWFYMDGSTDPQNWMTHIEVAKNKEEQNLEAVQLYGNIFFRTTRPIQSGTELKVFYSDDYREAVGLSLGLDQLDFSDHYDRFECKNCIVRYANAKSMLRHVKFVHNTGDAPIQLDHNPPPQSPHGQREALPVPKPDAVLDQLKPMNDGIVGAYLQTRRDHLKTGQNRKPWGSKTRRRPRKQPAQSDNSPQKNTRMSARKSIPTFKLKDNPMLIRKNTQTTLQKKSHISSQKKKKAERKEKNRKKKEGKTKNVKEEEDLDVDVDEMEAEYVCKKCGKQFPSHGQLKEHAAFHKETRGLKPPKPVCEICGLECKNKRAMNQHMLSHDSTSFQCKDCGKLFKRKGCFVYHLRQIHGQYVGEKWMRENQAEKLSRYVGPQPLAVEPETFHPEVPKDMLGKRIVDASQKPKIFKCKYCPRKFAANHEVFRHEKIAHINEGQFKCEFCSRNFMEEARLILHRRTHTKDRPFKCAMCPSSFGSESALQRHIPEHTGGKPFSCDICGARFASKNYMNTHKRRLHTTLEFKCSFCDKIFKLKTSHDRHERRHKGIRPFVCQICGKAFGTKYSLQAHATIHTGEKPFECKTCHQRFALNHLLTFHMIKCQGADQEGAVVRQMVEGEQMYTAVEISNVAEIATSTELAIATMMVADSAT